LGSGGGEDLLTELVGKLGDFFSVVFTELDEFEQVLGGRFEVFTGG